VRSDIGILLAVRVQDVGRFTEQVGENTAVLPLVRWRGDLQIVHHVAVAGIVWLVHVVHVRVVVHLAVIHRVVAVLELRHTAHVHAHVVAMRWLHAVDAVVTAVVDTLLHIVVITIAIVVMVAICCLHVAVVVVVVGLSGIVLVAVVLVVVVIVAVVVVVVVAILRVIRVVDMLAMMKLKWVRTECAIAAVITVEHGREPTGSTVALIRNIAIIGRLILSTSTAIACILIAMILPGIRLIHVAITRLAITR